MISNKLLEKLQRQIEDIQSDIQKDVEEFNNEYWLLEIYATPEKKILIVSLKFRNLLDLTHSLGFEKKSQICPFIYQNKNKYKKRNPIFKVITIKRVNQKTIGNVKVDSRTMEASCPI